MLHFNKRDLHEHNISYERFKEIVNNIFFKIDTTKYNVESLYNLTLQNMASTVEKKSIFVKKEIITEKENSDIYISKKNETQKNIENLIRYQTILILENEIVARLLKKESIKAAFIAYQEYLNAKAFDELIKIQNIDVQKAVEKMMEERRIALEVYKNDMMQKCMLMNEKIITLKNQAAYLQEKRENIFKESSRKIAARLNEIKSESGEGIFKKCTTKQKEAFVYEYIKRSDVSSRNLKNRKNKLIDTISDISKKLDSINSDTKQYNSHAKSDRSGTFLVGFNNKKRENEVRTENSQLIYELNQAEGELQALIEYEKQMKKQNMMEAMKEANINISDKMTEADFVNIINFFECDSSYNDALENALFISDKIDNISDELLKIKEESAALKIDVTQAMSEFYPEPDLPGIEGLGKVMGVLSSTEIMAEESALTYRSITQISEGKARNTSRLS